MWPFEFNSQIFVAMSIIFLAMMLWVTYSLKEFLLNFEQSKKKRRLRHLKDLEIYQSDLKRKN